MEIKMRRNNQTIYVDTTAQSDEKGKSYVVVKTVSPYCFKKREYLNIFKTVEKYIEWLNNQGFKVVE